MNKATKLIIRTICIETMILFAIYAIYKSNLPSTYYTGVITTLSAMGAVMVGFGISEMIIDFKKIFFLFIISFVLFSCSSKEQNLTKETKSQPVDTAQYVHYKMSDPVLFLGSDFVIYFQMLYKLGEYDKMLIFTSKESIKKHGFKKIRAFYRTMNFSYKLLLHSTTEENNIVTLNYESYINQTIETKRFMVKIENDSCRILLPDNLDDFSK